MIMDQDNNKRKREERGSSDDDDSSATKEYDIEESIKGKVGGRKTGQSLDQSIFPSDGSMPFNLKSAAAPPNFSCSPIAMQSSQPELYDGNENGRQTATASQLDRVLMPSAQKSDMKSPPPAICEKVQLEVASSKQSSARSKQQTFISREPSSHQSSLGSNKKKLSPKQKPRVSFQPQPRVILLNPSWTLSNEHTRCLRKCANDSFISMLKMPNDSFDNVDEFDSGFDFDTEEGRESFLAMLSSNRIDNCPPAPLSFYAISTEKDKEFTFGEAIIVPRSFPYYLAVACGLPIVDIEFISSAANVKRRGTMNHQRYPFPSLPGAVENKRAKKKSQKDCLVLGASNYMWDAPKKACTAAIDRHSLWQKEEGPHARLETLLPGTDLLHECSVLLLGDFDQANHSKRTVAKRRKRDSDTKGGGYCTRGNISLLLQLCGATVYDIDSLTASKNIKRGLTDDQLNDSQNALPSGALENGPSLNDTLQSIEEERPDNKFIVMVKDKSNAKLGGQFLNQMKSVASLAEKDVTQIPVVPCQWLLDSIGEFEAQDTSKYDNGGTA